MASVGCVARQLGWPASVPLLPRRHRAPPLPITGTAGEGTQFGRVDGLDGLRGIAVLAVLVFHLWPTLLPGGFIGVTLFFSLSGFLITSILVHELETTGSLSLRRFYGRRFRRLMPVSLATLTAVAVGWSLAGWSTPELRRDLFFSLGQNANWGQVLLSQRYGVDAVTSPVLHFWSLAIEEQLYLLLPLTILLCRTRRRALLAVAVGLGGSIAAVVLASGSASLSYYSTFTRGGEVLVGSLAALALHGRKWEGRRARVASPIVAVAGLCALGFVAVRLDVTSPWFAHGGLLMCGAVAVVVIAAVAGSASLGQRLDWWLLARLGQISYAVYLFHWPILQSLRRAGLDPAFVPWVTATTTVALALASERWFERPIRSGVVSGARVAAAGMCMAVLVPIVSVAGVASASQTPDFEAERAALDSLIGPGATTREADPPSATVPMSLLPVVVTTGTTPGSVDYGSAAASPEPTTAPVAPVRIGFFGDSKALTLALGTARAEFSEIEIGTTFVGLGCPTGLGGWYRSTRGAPAFETDAGCDWVAGIPASAAAWGALDLGVVWSGSWDIQDRKVPALGNRWTNITDAEYRAWLLTEMVRLTDTIMTSTGATKVLWLTVPIDPASPHPERFAEWTSLVLQLQAQRPEAVEMIDVAAYVAASGEASRLLPDGVHTTRGADDPAVNSGAELAEALILPALTSTS